MRPIDLKTTGRSLSPGILQLRHTPKDPATQLPGPVASRDLGDESVSQGRSAPGPRSPLPLHRLLAGYGYLGDSGDRPPSARTAQAAGFPSSQPLTPCGGNAHRLEKAMKKETPGPLRYLLERGQMQTKKNSLDAESAGWRDAGLRTLSPDRRQF